MRNELIRTHLGLIGNYQSFGMVRCSIKPPVDSRDLSAMRNGATERSNCCKSSRGIEQASGHKPYNVKIVQEANALRYADVDTVICVIWRI